MTIPAYPLQWPEGWPRTPVAKRESAKFCRASRRGSGSYSPQRSLTIAEGTDRVRKQLDAMRVRDDDLVISTNLRLRLDGFPRSDQREPDDAGVAVYWLDRGEQRCMAVDKYHRVADNLAAIAGTLEALRSIERYGGAQILDRAFRGFAALAPPASEHWRVVLGVGTDAGAGDIVAAYRRRRSETHPDRSGGNAEEFDRVQRAFDQAELELRTS